MEFGLFTEFQSPPGMTDAQAFDESMAQMCAGRLSYDEILGELAVYGTPEAVTDRLLELRETLGSPRCPSG